MTCNKLTESIHIKSEFHHRKVNVKLCEINSIIQIKKEKFTEMCCRCKKIYPQQEKEIMIKSFIVFILIQTIFAVGLCIISILYLEVTNFSWFMPIDMITLMIAVIILSLIVFIVGWASASSNTTFAWVWFHCFMFALLFIEMIISWFSSDVNNIMNLAQKAWDTSYIEDRIELQEDLNCCGFANTTDMPGEKCPPGDDVVGCKVKLGNLMSQIRDTASVALFVDFVFAMFIDFAGCAICFHPDVVTVEDQNEENMLMDQLSASPAYTPALNNLLDNGPVYT
ncbi:Tetraspanin family protein [Tritrichomonas foetus]|uniref:Tetraspanin family protein n=1 Tax=Tritrichomonas foetus TaxID=1144522 RepID=A0A1J4JWV9_9EUKA|nr:Tetraspanin family protein [Tritrichomonas foetus]|eukprot:OHT03631.1 Tetraspanin family protein [Tritrichomonas foetus]